MADTLYFGKRYRLRAGSSMPVAPIGGGEFVLHTFMAEENDVTSYSYKTTLPPSTDFRGQFGGRSLMSASFNRLQDISGQVFSGEEVEATVYIEEDDLNGAAGNLDSSTFMECTSLSISYDIMGRATISYTLISESSDLQAIHPIYAGGQTFTGYISSIDVKKIPKTKNYEIHVSIVATTD